MPPPAIWQAYPTELGDTDKCYELNDRIQARESILAGAPPNIEPTFVPDHPNLKAASCASNSPKPSINPLTKGKRRLIAAPLINPHMVGGEYRISGELEEEGGDGESSLFAE